MVSHLVSLVVKTLKWNKSISSFASAGLNRFNHQVSSTHDVKSCAAFVSCQTYHKYKLPTEKTHLCQPPGVLTRKRCGTFTVLEISLHWKHVLTWDANTEINPLMLTVQWLKRILTFAVKCLWWVLKKRRKKRKKTQILNRTSLTHVSDVFRS